MSGDNGIHQSPRLFAVERLHRHPGGLIKRQQLSVLEYTPERNARYRLYQIVGQF
jgi:hypothetical protein